MYGVYVYGCMRASGDNRRPQQQQLSHALSLVAQCGNSSVLSCALTVCGCTQLSLPDRHHPRVRAARIVRWLAWDVFARELATTIARRAGSKHITTRPTTLIPSPDTSPAPFQPSDLV